MSLTHEYHELLEMIPNMKTHDKATPRLKHSPGPWEASDTTNTSGQHVVSQSDTKHIGEVATVWGEGNAHLIAAAPDLLYSLELFMEFYSDLSTSNPGFMGGLVLQDYARYNELLLKAPRALAIAKGQITKAKGK